MGRANCVVADCTSPAWSGGYCTKHLARWRRYGDPNFVKTIKGDDETRFWSKVEKTNSCWLWTEPLHHSGYAQFKVSGKQTRAHRYSFFLAHGRWPEPNCLHSCDVRRCVNPAHLSEGTDQNNVDDMFERGRAVKARGSQTGMAKLNEEKVRDIRVRIAQKEPYSKVAALYGVSTGTIGFIVKRQTWAHI